MVNPDEIVERIRDFLSAEERVWDEDLTDAATAYTALCREANDRSRRCADYLRHGMRSEAVHLAWCQPPLLETVETLRLPDRADWVRACARQGLSGPPDLLLRASDPLIRELQEARMLDRSLEPLLARHRVLALSGAPVRDRLEVLRALAAKDPASPCWPSEVQDLEPVRLKEMRSEAKSAYRAKDLAATSAVWDELTGRPWRAEVPEDLRAGLEKALASLRLRASLDEVRRLLGELSRCFESGDSQRGATLLTEWQDLVEGRGLTLPPELGERVRPVLKWVTSEQRRRETARRMDAARPALRAGEEQLLRGRVLRRRTALWVAVGACAAATIATATLLFALHQRHP